MRWLLLPQKTCHLEHKQGWNFESLAELSKRYCKSFPRGHIVVPTVQTWDDRCCAGYEADAGFAAGSDSEAIVKDMGSHDACLVSMYAVAMTLELA